MSDSNHTITFTKVSSGTAGAGSLKSLIGTNMTCPKCSASVPVTTGDVDAYTQTHGQPQPTAVYRPTVVHGTGP
jgi:hypothetical protein